MKTKGDNDGDSNQPSVTLTLFAFIESVIFFRKEVSYQPLHMINLE